MDAKRKKSYEVSSGGWITVYPSLHEKKEKGMLRRILKRLIHLRKGHEKQGRVRCQDNTSRNRPGA